SGSPRAGPPGNGDTLVPAFHRQEDTVTTTERALQTWTIDPVHSSLEFSLEYMGISTFRTGFRAVEGSLALDPARPEQSAVTVSVPVAGVDVTTARLLGRRTDPAR